MLKQRGFTSVIFLIVFLAGILILVNSTSWFKYEERTLLPTESQSSTTTPSPSPTPTLPPKTNSPTRSPEPKSTSPTPQAFLTPPAQGPYEIRIIGESDCGDKTREALRLLNTKAQDHYQRVINYIGVIDCQPDGSGMYAWERPPRFRVGRETRDAGAIWYASAIAHDACHSAQYSDYIRKNPNVTSVPEDVFYGEKAELECTNVQHDAAVKLGADRATLDWINYQKSQRHWEKEITW